ncbi:hypothetical protein FB00_06855 [Cellulosimicrobium funkei]|uniref:Glycosyltransferase RgtA/B/C/D-like domain-containing protein n=1 Tax=Cellulosimicrobium funkei TaxID=264251 RepID=A0A0H2KPR3_9MICO|nr:hypothetical protein FB00_06855 [Cellulosimicrobium funkei]
MLEWLSTAHLGVVAVLLLGGPGLAVGYLGGLRGLVAWGSAPLLSSLVVGVSAIGGGLLGVRWSLLVVVAGTVVFAGVAWLARLASGGWRSPFVARGLRSRKQVLVTVTVAVLVAAGLQARRLMGAFGGPDQFPQTYDTPYHLNSLRLMLETGDASSLKMTLTTPELASSFYPGLWHGFVTLVLESTGSTDVVAGANWTTLVIACLVWPASVLVLARVLFGPRPVLLGLTAVMAFSMTQFPNQFTAFGILYPNLLAYALLPTVIALAWLTLWHGRGRRRVAPLALTGAGLVVMILAHPNALFTVGYVVLPLLVHFVAHVSRRAWVGGRRATAIAAPVVLAVSCTVAYWVVGLVPMVAEFRSQVSWPARLSRTDAINDAVGLSAMHPDGQANLFVAGLLLVGAVVALVVRRWRWLPFSYALLAMLFIVAASSGESTRELLTGYWYGDVQRLAALLPLLGVPLATIGLATVVDGLSRLARDHGSDPRWLRATSFPVLAAVAALLVLVVLPRTDPYTGSIRYVRDAYSTPEAGRDNAFVDEDEVAMMDEIEQIVPEGVVIAGNPWNGASMTWALADRESLFPHSKSLTTEDQDLIAQSLGDAGTDQAVCEALERTGVEYVLTSDSMLWGRHPEGFEGLDAREVRRVGEVVAREGDVRLWRITACDG